MRVDGKTLIKHLKDAYFEPRSYSGRAMYGRRCVGVTVDSDKVLSVGARLVAAVLDDSDDPFAIAEEYAELMDKARSDSMGLDMIIYWPDVAWPADEDEDEEADDDEDDR